MYQMDLVHIFGRMDESMRENGSTQRCMDQELINGQMDESM